MSYYYRKKSVKSTSSGRSRNSLDNESSSSRDTYASSQHLSPSARATDARPSPSNREAFPSKLPTPEKKSSTLSSSRLAAPTNESDPGNCTSSSAQRPEIPPHKSKFPARKKSLPPYLSVPGRPPPPMYQQHCPPPPMYPRRRPPPPMYPQHRPPPPMYPQYLPRFPPKSSTRGKQPGPFKLFEPLSAAVSESLTCRPLVPVPRSSPKTKQTQTQTDHDVVSPTELPIQASLERVLLWLASLTPPEESVDDLQQRTERLSITPRVITAPEEKSRPFTTSAEKTKKQSSTGLEMAGAQETSADHRETELQQASLEQQVSRVPSLAPPEMSVSAEQTKKEPTTSLELMEQAEAQETSTDHRETELQASSEREVSGAASLAPPEISVVDLHIQQKTKRKRIRKARKSKTSAEKTKEQPTSWFELMEREEAEETSTDHHDSELQTSLEQKVSGDSSSAPSDEISVADLQQQTKRLTSKKMSPSQSKGRLEEGAEAQQLQPRPDGSSTSSVAPRSTMMEDVPIYSEYLEMVSLEKTSRSSHESPSPERQSPMQPVPSSANRLSKIHVRSDFLANVLSSLAESLRKANPQEPQPDAQFRWRESDGTYVLKESKCTRTAENIEEFFFLMTECTRAERHLAERRGSDSAVEGSGRTSPARSSRPPLRRQRAVDDPSVEGVSGFVEERRAESECEGSQTVNVEIYDDDGNFVCRVSLYLPTLASFVGTEESSPQGEFHSIFSPSGRGPVSRSELIYIQRTLARLLRQHSSPVASDEIEADVASEEDLRVSVDPSEDGSTVADRLIEVRLKKKSADESESDKP